MIDFDVDWSRWFGGIEQPNDETISRARRDASGCLSDAAHIETDDIRTLDDLKGAVEDALEGMRDAQEEIEARFKDAEFAADQAREALVWLLNHHKAVLVTNAIYKSDPVEVRPVEVMSWCDNNCRGTYQVFDVDKHAAIIFFDDADRLHCKLRFG